VSAAREGLSIWNRFGRRVIWRHLRATRRVNWRLVFYDSTEWIARLRCRAIGSHIGVPWGNDACACCGTWKPSDVDPVATQWAARARPKGVTTR
jgi:hypothetical protein